MGWLVVFACVGFACLGLFNVEGLGVSAAGRRLKEVGWLVCAFSCCSVVHGLAERHRLGDVSGERASVLFVI